MKKKNMVIKFMFSTLKRKGKKMLPIFMKAFFFTTISKEWLYNGIKILYILEDSRIVFIYHKTISCNLFKWGHIYGRSC